MNKIKVLNLYACLGGNRYKWDDAANIEVTAVECDEELAKLYQKRFPNDKVIIADAHQYLLDHYKEFDFIWSSPPCPSHSRARFARKNTTTAIYPDLKLYEEVLFLENYFDGKYCVENVIPYYEPLIAAKKRGRHLYWTNFNLPNILSNRKSPDFTRIKDEYSVLSDFHDIKGIHANTGGYRNVLRNLVDYEAGKTIFETYLGIEKKSNEKQTSIFDII